jgi:5'-nucleotidase
MLVVIWLLFAACPVQNTLPPQRGSSGKTVEVTLIGTADLHGRIWQLPLFAGYMKAIRAARPGRVVLVDGGDMFQGSLESDLNEGEAVVRAYQVLRYDAVALGNHEFDYGPVGPKVTAQGSEDDPQGALKARARQAAGSFPFLAANVLERGKPLAWDNVRPSTLVRLSSGVQVGVIGVSTIHTPRTTIRANFVGLGMRSLSEAITEQAAALRSAGAHIVIVAAHAGGNCRSFADPNDLSSCGADEEIFEVARKLPRGSVDAIVGGHTHAGVAHRVAGIPIVQAYALGTAFGRIDFTVDLAASRVTAAHIHRPVELVPQASYEGVPLSEDKAIASIVAQARFKARSIRNALLGVEIGRPLTRRYDGESPLGNFVTSMMLELEPRASIAITNGGGLRADLPSGPLRYGSLYDALPFENRLALVSMTGKQVRELFARNLVSTHGVFSPAGARVAARCDSGKLVVDVWLEKRNGASPRAEPPQPMKDDDKLVVVTNDFLATGGDGFTVTDNVELNQDRPALRDAIAERLRERPGKIDAQDWYSMSSPRIKLPMPRPVRCD